MTNREKEINKMTNEELAKKIYFEGNCPCKYCMYKDNHCEVDGVEDIDPKYCMEKIKEWLDSEAEMTADDMFEELGYKKTTKSQQLFSIHYEKSEGYSCPQEIKFFQNSKGKWEYEKYYIAATRGDIHTSLLITEEEHQAICKKLEELKDKKEE